MDCQNLFEHKSISKNFILSEYSNKLVGTLSKNSDEQLMFVKTFYYFVGVL